MSRSDKIVVIGSKVNERKFVNLGSDSLITDPAKALEYLQQAYEINLGRKTGITERPNILNLIIIALFKTAQYKEAIKMSEEAIKHTPDVLKFYLSKNTAHCKLCIANTTGTLPELSPEAQLYKLKGKTFDRLVKIEPMMVFKGLKTELANLKALIIQADKEIVTADNFKVIVESFESISKIIDTYNFGRYDSDPTLTAQIHEFVETAFSHEDEIATVIESPAAGGAGIAVTSEENVASHEDIAHENISVFAGEKPGTHSVTLGGES